MNEKKTVKIHLECGEVKADFEGEANQVLESIIRFLSQIYPSLEVARKIIYAPDLTDMINSVSGILEITADGPVINPAINLSAKNAICLALLGAYIGNRVGKLQKDTLSISELSRLTGKARKTISNDIPKLIDSGIVEKISEGEYRITQLGIKRIEDIVKSIKGS